MVSERDKILDSMKDERVIGALVVDYNQRVHSWNPAVGNNGVTKIEAYGETGEMAYVPWFAVYVDDEIRWRINGKYVVEIYYANR